MDGPPAPGYLERMARTPSDVDIDPGPDPVIEAYKRHVDRTLIRENLRKTPEERVRLLVELQRLAEEARRAGRKAGLG